MSEKKFEIALEKQLELFRTAGEWSDLVAYLTGLEGILKINKYSRIPKPYLLYKRLNQCLNPALPAGVHMKALGVYKIVISKISSENLLNEIDVLSLGLFTFYSHSNLTSIPNYMEVVKKIIETLGDKTIKICKKLIFGIIMGLEEENSEQYIMTQQILNILELRLGRGVILKNVWEVMGQCTDLVPGCLVYILKAEGGCRAMEGEECLLSRGFVSALKAKEIVTIRKSFDLFYSYKVEGLDLKNNEIDVAVAILNLFLVKEISLVKRIQMWITEMMKKETGVDEIYTALCRIFHGSPSAYFKILMAIRQNIEEASAILKRSLVWTISIIDTRNSADITAFFKVLDKRIVWEVFSEDLLDTGLIDKAISHSLLDEHSQAHELPLIAAKCIEAEIYPYHWAELLSPSPDAYRSIWEAVEKKISAPSDDALLLIDFFLSINISEESLEMYKKSVEVIMATFMKYWEQIAHSKAVHYMIIKSLRRITVEYKMSHEECAALYDSAVVCPEVFWLYDSWTAGNLQKILINRIVYNDSTVRHVLEEAEELRLAFYLVENCENAKLDSNFICFLISFCESHSYMVRQKAQSFCRRIRAHAGILTNIYAHLNNPIEREIKEKVILLECDYHRILFGLQILASMVKYSDSFQYYLKNEETFPEESDVFNVTDLSEQFVGVSEASRPGMGVFFLVLMYATSEHAEVRGKEQKYIQEIEEMSVKILKYFFCFVNFLRQPITFREDFVCKLLQRSKTEQAITSTMTIAAMAGLDAYYDCISEIYRETEEIRYPLIKYCISKNQINLLLILVKAICDLVAEDEQNEMHQLEYILQHSFNLKGYRSICKRGHGHMDEQKIAAGQPAKLFNVLDKSREADGSHWRQKQDNKCSCGLENMKVENEGAVTLLISYLLDLFTHINEQTNKKANRAVGMLQKDSQNLKTLRKYFTSIQKLFTQLLSEGLIGKYSECSNISFINAIDGKIESEVFASVVRVTSTLSQDKYKMLKRWIEVSPNRSVFESAHIFGAISMIIVQAKTKPKDTDLLWFFTVFFKKVFSQEGIDLSVKALDACVIFGFRLGTKKILDIAEINEKCQELSELLRIVKSIISSAIKKNYLLDLSSVWSSLVFPCFKLPPDHALYKNALETAKELVQMPENNRQWKKDFYEYLLSDRFFKDNAQNIRYKIEIGSFLVDSDRILDLISRANTTAGFFVRESDILLKASLIKRLRYMILCAPFAEYVQNAPGIFSLISEIFSSSSNTSVCLLSEAYALCRALCIKMPVNTLINMWPITISEAISALSSGLNTNDEISVAYAALQFLDLVASLNYPETIEFRWLVEGLSELKGPRIHLLEHPPLKDERSSEHESGLRDGISYRVPCRVKLAEKSKQAITKAISKVSEHHKNQKHCTEIDSAVFFDSLADDFPEI
ncbi:hypothetical protein NEMIN01_1085 [Nematocida minor]|uniref:uncharacterized protein n=1 Tax=Nematocida minor TaxID=1912983 RepID=UPI0022207A14|nr:uncharacterized protein NEMIN01_1085 [Nematocida minor]KAI5190547.1 hypothetical protein NEMIN01_1085 [Nematocida minor]